MGWAKEWKPPKRPGERVGRGVVPVGRATMEIDDQDLRFLCTTFLQERHASLWGESYAVKGQGADEEIRRGAEWLAGQIRQVLGGEILLPVKQGAQKGSTPS